MNPHFTPEENAFRLEVRAFMEALVPPSIRRKMLLGQRWSRDDMITWQRILDAKGWGGAAGRWSGAARGGAACSSTSFARNSIAPAESTS